MGTVREDAKKLLESLPDEASWDDIMYEMYVRKKIDQGIIDANEGKLISHEEVKKRVTVHRKMGLIGFTGSRGKKTQGHGELCPCEMNE